MELRIRNRRVLAVAQVVSGYIVLVEQYAGSGFITGYVNGLVDAEWRNARHFDTYEKAMASFGSMLMEWASRLVDWPAALAELGETK